MLLLAGALDALTHASPLGIAALGVALLLVLGGVVLWGVHHADSRRR